MARCVSSFLVLAASLCLLALQVNCKVQVVAHRGDSEFAPENTLVGFRQAIAKGADAVECDLRLTKDEVLVLMHDETVDRTTNGTGYIGNLTLAQVQRLDAGSWFGAAFAGEPVPTLKQLMQLMMLYPNVTLNIDLKSPPIFGPYVRALFNQSEFAGLEKRVVTSCWNNVDAVDMSTNLAASSPIKVGMAPVLFGDEYFEEELAAGIRGFSLNYYTLSTLFILAAQGRSMPVWTWTVNDEIGMRLMITKGVDGIITDNPALLVSVLAQVALEDGSSASSNYQTKVIVGSTFGAVGGIAIFSVLAVVLYKRRRARYTTLSP